MKLALALVVAGCGESRVTNDLSAAATPDLALSVDASFADAAMHGARDWDAHPAIVQLDTSADLYAVGDVHGDYDTIVKLLVGAGLLAAPPGSPSSPVWTGGDAVLVCTGDLVDKGPRSLDVVTLFESLRAPAEQSGGRVIVTAGNHEAEFLAAPDPTRDFDVELAKAGISVADVEAGTVAPGPYLRNLPFAARVNDWFFAHAGNTQGRTLAELSAALQNGIDAQGWGAPIVTAGDSLLEARLSNGASPWWGKPATALSTLQTYASAAGASHLVMGHQPGSFALPDGTTRKADALAEWANVIYFIDVGMSVGVDDSKGPLLHVHEGVTEAIFPDGTKKPI